MAEKKFRMKRKRADGTYDTYFPETKADIVGMADGESVEGKVTSHLADTMPHRFVDGTTTYRWGLAVINGVVNMIYEEVS